MPPLALPPSRTALRLAFALALAAVLVLSLLPTASLPPVDTGWDKADHALAWLGLGLLGLAAWPGRAAAVLAGLVAFGGLVECLQGLTGYRYAEWADLLADAIGAAAAGLLHAALRRRPRTGERQG